MAVDSECPSVMSVIAHRIVPSKRQNKPKAETRTSILIDLRGRHPSAKRPSCSRKPRDFPEHHNVRICQDERTQKNSLPSFRAPK
ncbi:uncharacterized protein SPSK_00636 [Sporothrix schenckii 1099-18]|uniref:Uncharacterized protein n=1 Tax=Sporothrix schenckii 1099-18 TaxID=1397361 RepID=A0A0F2LQT6_SPOSC|nr:uncharacterized protein SPSK_00636 [Sporothrix schenckii 1099-18]KJR79918.1 hypothetical protein SPSK_00636 [Sporothrix schenckii 1099-18]